MTRRVRKSSMPWIDQDIKNEIRLKNEIYDKANKSDLHVCWDLYKQLRNRVSNMIKIAKKTYYTDLIIENKDKPRLMWKYLKELLPGSQKESPTGLLVDGKSVTGKKAMANIFNRFFTSIGEKLANNIPNHPACNINTPDNTLPSSSPM